MTTSAVGLSRHELEREMTWLLRRLPRDPTTIPAALAELVVALIDKNNAALATDLARRDPPPEETSDY